MIKLAASLLAISLTSVTALAGESLAPTIAVSHDDLDLSTPAGQKALDRRLTVAARKVCGYAPAAGRIAVSSAVQACYNSARNSAEPQKLAAVEASQARYRLAGKR